MRMLAFSSRCTKEILRDPLDLGFGLGFPLIVLALLTAIQKNIPVPLFELEGLAPGITVFGLSFFTLFSALLISRDRETAFLQRLYTTPLTATDFIMGYMLPFIPIALLQVAFVYIVSLLLGLGWSVNIIWATLSMVLPTAFFIGVGLLCGSSMGSKQVGGICGALFTNVAAWMSGIWFDVDLVGGFIKHLAEALPFVHAVEMERAIIRGDFAGIMPHVWWVAGYALIVMAAAVAVFLRQMKRQ